MSKDFEHVDVNELVQDVPLEELPEVDGILGTGSYTEVV